MEKSVRWYYRVNVEIYYLIIINFVVIAVDYHFFIRFVELIELVIFALILLSLLRKSSRIVFKVKFDDRNKNLDVHFYQFIIINCRVSIPYSQLNFEYQLKSYGIGNVMNVLVFLSANKRIAEITEKNRIGWTKVEIAKIIEKLYLIENERND